MDGARTAGADVETDARLPSGPWTGFYIQWGRRGRQELGLRFAGGVISGGGRDAAGLFVVSGSYDAAEGRCAMVKCYDGYQVEYDGFIDNNGIWGRWRISYAPLGPDDRGHFHIWPAGSAGAEALDAEAEEPVGVWDSHVTPRNAVTV